MDFEWIWKMNCLNKIKIFIWQCLYDRLTCRAYLAHIGINIDPICPICKKEEEFIPHIFFYCNTTRQLWDSMRWSNFYEPLGRRWLIQVRNFDQNLGEEIISWKFFYPFSLQNIWINKNNNNQNNTSNPINIDCIKQRSIEYKFLTGSCHSPTKKTPIKTSWHKPPKDWYKLNIYTSFKKNNHKLRQGFSSHNNNKRSFTLWIKI